MFADSLFSSRLIALTSYTFCQGWSRETLSKGGKRGGRGRGLRTAETGARCGCLPHSAEAGGAEQGIGGTREREGSVGSAPGRPREREVWRVQGAGRARGRAEEYSRFGCWGGGPPVKSLLSWLGEAKKGSMDGAPGDRWETERAAMRVCAALSGGLRQAGCERARRACQEGAATGRWHARSARSASRVVPHNVKARPSAAQACCKARG